MGGGKTVGSTGCAGMGEGRSSTRLAIRGALTTTPPRLDLPIMDVPCVAAARPASAAAAKPPAGVVRCGNGSTAGVLCAAESSPRAPRPELRPPEPADAEAESGLCSPNLGARASSAAAVVARRCQSPAATSAAPPPPRLGPRPGASTPPLPWAAADRPVAASLHPRSTLPSTAGS